MKRIASLAFALSLAAGAASAAEKLVFAWTPNPATPQVDMALAEGLFEAEGVEIELVAFRTGREGFEALIGGQVDVAFMAELPATIGALREQPFKVIADLSRFRGARIIASAKEVDLKSIADLEGMKLGTTLGTNVDFFLDRALKGAGVQAEIVNASPGDLAPALARGDIAAATMFPTFYGAARGLLGDDYRDIRSDAYSVHYIVSASDAALAEKRPAIDAFLRALVAGDARVAADPAAAQAAVLSNLGGAMPAETLEGLWTETEVGTSLDKELLALLTDQGGWVVGRGVIEADAPTEADFLAFFETGPLAAAKPEAVTLD